MKRIIPIITTLVVTLLSQPIIARETISHLRDQTAVAVTIYNSNLALIKDRRFVDLFRGKNDIAFRGVSAQMRPETALLRSISHPGNLKILEQNFDYDLLTPQKLLEKFVGKTIRVATTNPATGIEKIETATVLSTNSGVVLKIGNRIETNHKGRYIFDVVPENLKDKPTLSTQLVSELNAQQDIELSYLSRGLSWKADYVAELNAEDNQLDLMAWVTLNNQSGTSYNNANMQLVAGDVNQVRAPNRGNLERMQMKRSIAMADSAIQEESLFEYHLYSLDRTTSILNKQSKQVSLLTASAVPVAKEYLLNGNNYYYQGRYNQIGEKLKVAVFVQFDNKEELGLGLPLPKGIVRVYKRDKRGNAQFIGEDSIDHTPNKESVRLKLGNAFDVTADKIQTDFKLEQLTKHKRMIETAYEITLKNAKTTPVVVTVREPIPLDWTMIRESHLHQKVSSNVAEWKVLIAAESSTRLTYRVRTKN